MDPNKKQVWLPFFLSVSLIVGMIFGYKLHENMGDFAPHFGNQNNLNNQFNEVLELIKSRYVDKIFADSLKKKTIESLIQQLDPHSSYIPAEEADDIKEELQGNYHGIGIQFELINDTVTVISLFNNSPAKLAGLRIGDQIIKADSFLISGNKLDVTLIKNRIRGSKGSLLTLTILENKNLFTISVQRSKISSNNIDAAYMLEPGIAYVRISKFSGNAYEEFMEHLERLKKEGMDKLILDLRDNGGGVLDDAIQIADEFLSGNKEIVRTKGENIPLEIYAAKRPGLFETGKLIILINENTASASEVLAGAIQDWSRGVIMGRRSFGKGLVQEQFTLSDGSAIRLTVARYYTPLGRSIQKPYHSGTDSNYTEELSNRLKNGELFNDNIPPQKGKSFLRADGLRLYDGEGIRPDIFIPADITLYNLSNQHTNLHESLTKIALSYYQKNQNLLSSLKKENELTALLQNDPAVLKSIDELQTEIKGNESRDLQPFLLREIRYILSWMLWDEEGYYKTCNKDDVVIKKL